MTDHLTAVPDPSETTFAMWMRTHARPLRRMCARLLRDDALAEDIVQETLLRAWTRRDRFADGADMGPWLRCVARNLCIEHLRTRGRMVPSSDALPDHPDLDADPTAPLERAEEHRYVREALQTLSERHRALLVARDIEGVDYSELARREGVNEDAARAVLFRARRILRDRYLAVARAVGAAVLWVRIRAKHSAGRLAAPAVTAAGASIASAVAACAVLVVATVAAVGGAIGVAPPDRSAAESLRASAPAAVRSSDPDLAPWPATILRAPGGVTAAASADRKAGTARARATARNPVTGNDEYVWTRVWREQGGDGDSVVLTAADDAADSACAQTSGRCDTADQLLKDPGGTLP